MGVVKRTREIALGVCAAIAWLASLCAVISYARGGARRADDYVARIVHSPLKDGKPLLATDEGNAFWSGWAPDGATHRRLAYVMDPDIAFLRDASATGCIAMIAAAPRIGASQPVYITLNGATPPALLIIDHDGMYAAALNGATMSGVNTLSFRLPEARPAMERMQSIALRSLALDCKSGPEDRDAPSKPQQQSGAPT